MERTRPAPIATFFTTEEPLEPRSQVSLGDSVARHLRARRLGTGATVALIDVMPTIARPSSSVTVKSTVSRPEASAVASSIVMSA